MRNAVFSLALLTTTQALDKVSVVKKTGFPEGLLPGVVMPITAIDKQMWRYIPTLP